MELAGKESQSMLQLWFFSNTGIWPFGVNLAGLNLQVNVVLLIFAGAFLLIKKRQISVSSAKVLGLLVAYAGLSFLTAALGPCSDKLAKSLITAPIMIVLVFLGWEIGRTATNTDWLGLYKSAIAAIIVAFVGFLVELAEPSWFPLAAKYRVTGRLSGFFQEPSVVGFSLFPCIAVLLVAETKKVRLTGICLLGCLLLISRSSTMLALIAAWILYRLVFHRRLRQAVLVAVGFAGLIGLGSLVNYDALVAPTVDRIAGLVLSNQTDNISSLVYIQGWQDALTNLVRTHGLGLGFNMMGCYPLPDVQARQLLTLGGFGELNAENGSFQFSKTVSEAGVAGIAFYLATIWWWLQLEKRTRKLADNAERCVYATQAAIMFCFLASSFIRGEGYFSGSLLLWLVATSASVKAQQRQSAGLGLHPMSLAAKAQGH